MFLSPSIGNLVNQDSVAVVTHSAKLRLTACPKRVYQHIQGLNAPKLFVRGGEPGTESRLGVLPR